MEKKAGAFLIPAAHFYAYFLSLTLSEKWADRLPPNNHLTTI